MPLAAVAGEADYVASSLGKRMVWQQDELSPRAPSVNNERMPHRSRDASSNSDTQLPC